MISIKTLEAQDVPMVGNMYDLYWSGPFREKLSLKMDEFLDQVEKAKIEDVHYCVAKDGDKIVGAISFRKCPDSMLKYSKTDNPIEIYILAARSQGKGAGKILMQKAFEIAKDSGYTEAVLFNSDSHQESRGFYKYLGFVEAGAAAAPDGEMGQVFSTLL